MKTVIDVISVIILLSFVMLTGQMSVCIAQEETAEQQDTTEDPLEYTRPRPQYNSDGKRDPFQVLIPEVREDEKKIKGLFNYEGAKLTGIVRSKDDTYALVVDENSFGYVLRQGYKVFGGYVKQITDDALHFHIVKYGRSMSIIMRLESSKSAVYEEKEQGDSFVKKPGIVVTYKKEAKAGTEVKIEDVSVPSIDIKTIEEEWFGSKDSINILKDSDTDESSKEYIDSFSLINPPDNSWITLPYVMDWSKMAGENISYTIVIDDDSDFSTPLLIIEGLMSSSFLLNEDIQLPLNRDLFWKIIAQDVSGTSITCRRTDMSFRIIGKK